MQELKAEKPIESPDGTDPVTRLMARLSEEGFKTDQGQDEWKDFGEIIYARPEKISVARGETIFIFTRVPEINQVIYPDVEEKVASVRPRIEYLQYLLGERRENVDMHRMTVQAFYISLAVVVLLLIAVGFSFIR